MPITLGTSVTKAIHSVSRPVRKSVPKNLPPDWAKMHTRQINAQDRKSAARLAISLCDIACNELAFVVLFRMLINVNYRLKQVPVQSCAAPMHSV
jgi:hypothetical protein